ncbi:hypothetical protein SCHPADRAFT_894895 [Schizopora paradoxa]|uniref:Uncharacterized protein n=1 Tax=Schizopora paradoxa TaxID=27342 RepID=A0A0H2R5R6_9AGAM|nr:hypothetical protein SCHPADRAFT_894895 [Schizopora paradoxa]
MYKLHSMGSNELRNRLFPFNPHHPLVFLPPPIPPSALSPFPVLTSLRVRILDGRRPTWGTEDLGRGPTGFYLGSGAMGATRGWHLREALGGVSLHCASMLDDIPPQSTPNPVNASRLGLWGAENVLHGLLFGFRGCRVSISDFGLGSGGTSSMSEATCANSTRLHWKVKARSQDTNFQSEKESQSIEIGVQLQSWSRDGGFSHPAKPIGV